MGWLVGRLFTILPDDQWNRDRSRAARHQYQPAAINRQVYFDIEESEPWKLADGGFGHLELFAHRLVKRRLSEPHSNPPFGIIRVSLCHYHKYKARQPLRPDRIPGQHATRNVELIVYRRSRFGQKGPRKRDSAEPLSRGPGMVARTAALGEHMRSRDRASETGGSLVLRDTCPIGRSTA